MDEVEPVITKAEEIYDELILKKNAPKISLDDRLKVAKKRVKDTSNKLADKVKELSDSLDSLQNPNTNQL